MRSTGRRNRRSNQEQQDLVERFEASGLVAKQFCRRGGVALSNLQRWRRRTTQAPAAEFVELVPASGPRIAASWSPIGNFSCQSDQGPVKSFYVSSASTLARLPPRPILARCPGEFVTAAEAHGAFLCGALRRTRVRGTRRGMGACRVPLPRGQSRPCGGVRAATCARRPRTASFRRPPMARTRR